MPRFVLLFHDCPFNVPRPSHCDLMLEAGGLLRTWVLEEMPRDWAAVAGSNTETLQLAPENTVSAERIGDHRLAYLDYEGPVSGDRGSVRRLDRGTFEVTAETDDRWEVTLAGNVLGGQISLRRKAGDDVMWRLTVGD